MLTFCFIVVGLKSQKSFFDQNFVFLATPLREILPKFWSGLSRCHNTGQCTYILFVTRDIQPWVYFTKMSWKHFYLLSKLTLVIFLQISCYGRFILPHPLSWWDHIFTWVFIPLLCGWHLTPLLSSFRHLIMDVSSSTENCCLSWFSM